MIPNFSELFRVDTGQCYLGFEWRFYNLMLAKSKKNSELMRWSMVLRRRLAAVRVQKAARWWRLVQRQAGCERDRCRQRQCRYTGMTCRSVAHDASSTTATTTSTTKRRSRAPARPCRSLSRTSAWFYTTSTLPRAMSSRCAPSRMDWPARSPMSSAPGHRTKVSHSRSWICYSRLHLDHHHCRRQCHLRLDKLNMFICCNTCCNFCVINK